MIPNKETIWHVSELLAVLRGNFERRGDLVGDDVVHVGGPTGPGVPQPHDLHGGRSESKQLIASTLGVAVHVHQYVDPIGIDSIGSLAIVWDL